MANFWIVEDHAGWGVKQEGADRVASRHPTQQEAIDAAHPLVVESGGGELIIKGRDGWIRDKRTIGKHDPYPPAG